MEDLCDNICKEIKKLIKRDSILTDLGSLGISKFEKLNELYISNNFEFYINILKEANFNE